MTIEPNQPSGQVSPTEYHPECFVCGRSNAHGLGLNFKTAQKHTVTASFCCPGFYEGYPGIVHGGIIASIVDGAMTNCLFAHQVVAVTAELAVRFRAPVETNCPATVVAEITRSDYPLYVLEAKIIQKDKVKVMAKGKFLKKP